MDNQEVEIEDKSGQISVLVRIDTFMNCLKPEQYSIAIDEIVMDFESLSDYEEDGQVRGKLVLAIEHLDKVKAILKGTKYST